MIDKESFPYHNFHTLKNPRLLLTCVGPMYSMYDILKHTSKLCPTNLFNELPKE
jgi:hypothetical protein